MLRLSSTILQRRTSSVLPYRAPNFTRHGITTSLSVPVMPLALCLSEPTARIRSLSTSAGPESGGTRPQPWKYRTGKRPDGAPKRDPTPRMKSQMLTDRLKKIIGAKNRKGAWELFKAAKERGDANVFHWTLMMQLVDTGSERRSMIDEMVTAGIKPSAATYNTLANQMMLEGSLQSDDVELLEADMAAAGVAPTDGTRWLFEMSEEQRTKRRTRHIREMVERKARGQAWTFFAELKKNCVVNVFHWNAIMPLVETSAKLRSMMDEMTESGVDPDIVSYNNLANMLMLEGKSGAAKALEAETQAVGLEPDDHTRALFGMPEWAWQHTRQEHLLVLVKKQLRVQAWAYFEELQASGAANVAIWTMMMQLVNTSTEQRGLIDQMVQSGVTPTIVTYHHHANQLLFEGKYEEARALETEMLPSGLEFDEHALRLFKVPEAQWSRRRTMHLKGLVKSKGKSIEHAEAFFAALRASGAANVFHWNIMLQLYTGPQRRGMIDEMVQARVKPNTVSYNTLASQMLLEGKSEEARLLEAEMLDAGVQPDDFTHALFEKPEHEWSRMRTQRLRDMVKAEAIEQAWDLFEEFELSGAANFNHMQIMQPLCDPEAKTIDKMDYPQQIDVEECTILFTKMMMEGKDKSEEAVALEAEMIAGGVTVRKIKRMKHKAARARYQGYMDERRQKTKASQEAERMKAAEKRAAKALENPPI